MLFRLKNFLCPQGFVWLETFFIITVTIIITFIIFITIVLIIFTRGRFWPSVIVVACECVFFCPFVRLCVSLELVCAITFHLFKLESPNLVQKCKTPWLKSLLFFWVHWPWTSRSNLTWTENVSHFVLVHVISHLWLKLEAPNSDKRCKTLW